MLQNHISDESAEDIASLICFIQNTVLYIEDDDLFRKVFESYNYGFGDKDKLALNEGIFDLCRPYQVLCRAYSENQSRKVYESVLGYLNLDNGAYTIKLISEKLPILFRANQERQLIECVVNIENMMLKFFW